MFKNTARMIHELCTNEHYQAGNFFLDLFISRIYRISFFYLWYSLFGTLNMHVESSIRSHSLPEEIHHSFGRVAINRAGISNRHTSFQKEEGNFRWKNKNSLLVRTLFLHSSIRKYPPHLRVICHRSCDIIRGTKTKFRRVKPSKVITSRPITFFPERNPFPPEQWYLWNIA